MKKRVIIPAAAGAFTAFALGEMYRYIFCRNPGLIGLFRGKKGHKSDYYAHRDGEADKLRKRACLRMELRNDRGNRLQGYYYCCSAAPCGRVAFIVHGYRSEHAETAGMYYDCYVSRGFDIFTCDLTAAGESEGLVIGYDVYESRDVLLWLDELVRRFGSDIRIILHGFSMGGATVLKLSDRCPKQVRFIVSDSGFTSAADILRERLGPAYRVFSAISRAVAGYGLNDTDVRRNLAKADRPVLFVHGAEDRTVPLKMGQELFELCPAEKDCLFVPGARHVESMHVDPEGYSEKLDSFIAKYID